MASPARSDHGQRQVELMAAAEVGRRRPPWWTRRRVAAAAGLLGFVVGFALSAPWDAPPLQWSEAASPTVAYWVTAIATTATVGGVGFSIWAWRRDRAVEQRRLEVEDAVQVTFALEAKLKGRAPDWLRHFEVKNAGHHPVYDLVYRRIEHDGSIGSERDLKFLLLAARTEQWDVDEPEGPRDGVDRRQFQLHFRDRRNRVWCRRGDGLLFIVDETAAVDEVEFSPLPPTPA